ncbi:MAG TPA: DUF5818 domain-containing protein [Sphingobium sp.]|uniref:DUF5818 domain-containing protein n=1 Tax=Sphingobium sp. TaxID=1912891 RepID=UPI002ED22D87
MNNQHITITGTIETTARGPMLKDADGMWWRLIGEFSQLPAQDTAFRIVGEKRGEAAIEIHYFNEVSA